MVLGRIVEIYYIMVYLEINAERTVPFIASLLGVYSAVCTALQGWLYKQLGEFRVNYLVTSIQINV